MNYKGGVMRGNESIVFDIVSYLFGIAVFATGLIKTFWGNDPGFGIFLLILSVIYFPPANALLKKTTNFSIRPIVKVLVGIFIIVAAFGVGELLDKIDLMIMDL